MPTMSLDGETDFDGWRLAARRLRSAGVAPEAVVWSPSAILHDATDRHIRKQNAPFPSWA